jgi:hypothetical protein
LPNGTWTARAGREIRRLGWISPHPEQLYRVNASTIGYTGGEPIQEDESVFGHDTLGVSVTWHPRDQPVEITGMLNNGFWSWTDGGSGNRPVAGRQRNGLGYGIDAAFIPSKQVRIDLQIAYDPRSAYYDDYSFGIRDGVGVDNEGTFERVYTGADDAGGDIWLIDLNATVKPTSPLTLGAEIARFTIDDSLSNGSHLPDTDYSRWQGLVMANWAFEGARFPMSTTAMIQHIRAEHRSADGQAWEYSAALLTRPWHDVPLHLDVEIAYQTVETDTSSDSHGIELSGRALLTF